MLGNLESGMQRTVGEMHGERRWVMEVPIIVSREADPCLLEYLQVFYLR